MSKIAKVDSIKYSSKEEELKRLIKSLGDSGKTFELFEQDNPLKNVFVVKQKSQPIQRQSRRRLKNAVC